MFKILIFCTILVTDRSLFCRASTLGMETVVNSNTDERTIRFICEPSLRTQYCSLVCKLFPKFCSPDVTTTVAPTQQPTTTAQPTDQPTTTVTPIEQPTTTAPPTQQPTTTAALTAPPCPLTPHSCDTPAFTCACKADGWYEDGWNCEKCYHCVNANFASNTFCSIIADLHPIIHPSGKTMDRVPGSVRCTNYCPSGTTTVPPTTTTPALP